MSPSIFAALAAGGALLSSILLYHCIFVGPHIRGLRRKLENAEPRALLALEGSDPSFITRTDQRLIDLERLFGREVHRPGFIRYNAFDDVGSELSYAFALLNNDGDGVVLSSIFSREETRTFGKRVRNFVADQDVSKEEREAISLARSGMGSQVS